MKKNEMGAVPEVVSGPPTKTHDTSNTASALHICSFNYKPHIPDWRCVWCGKDARRVGEVKK